MTSQDIGGPEVRSPDTVAEPGFHDAGEARQPESPEPAPAPSRRWSILRSTAFGLILLVAFYAVQLVALIVFAAIELVRHPDEDPAVLLDGLATDGGAMSYATIACALVCVPLARFLAGRREDDPWGFLGMRPVHARTIGVWLGVIVAFIAFLELVTPASEEQFVRELMAALYATAPPALLFFALAFAAPVCEELIFRGFVPAALGASGAPSLLAAVISSALWAAMHVQYDLYWISVIFVLGLLLSLARTRTGSLWTCLAMHAVWNAISFIETALLS